MQQDSCEPIKGRSGVFSEIGKQVKNRDSLIADLA
jgi:hypothetical protein